MGKIFEDYKSLIKNYSEVIPDEILDLINEINNDEFEELEIDEKHKNKFFIENYEGLSKAVFNLLHSGIGMYIMNYAAEYKVNRKSAGFNDINDLVHFAVWTIETYNRNKPHRIKKYDELRDKDKGKNKDDILKQLILCNELKKDLYEVTFNMKNEEDFVKRLTLIELLEENECLAYNIISGLSHHKQIDDIYTELSSIENINEYNIAPKPLEQGFWDSRTV